MNDNKSFFHVFADGALGAGFILSIADYIAVMNIIAVCAANSGVVIVAFSIEDTHPHFLILATREDCARFITMFDSIYCHFATRNRPKGCCPHIRLEMYPVADVQSLRNVAVYVINQPTKDGKKVMPYDYLWGSGSLYFRTSYIPVWLITDDGGVVNPVKFSSLSAMKKRQILHTRQYSIPGDWLVAGDIILPSNYVDIACFEAIYSTHNAFRVFMSNNKSRDDEIRASIAQSRGIQLEDMEARQLCGDECKLMYGTRDPRRLDAMQRVNLAQMLRRKWRLSLRQLASLVRLPEIEVRRYVV